MLENRDVGVLSASLDEERILPLVSYNGADKEFNNGVDKAFVFDELMRYD